MNEIQRVWDWQRALMHRIDMRIANFEKAIAELKQAKGIVGGITTDLCNLIPTTDKNRWCDACEVGSHRNCDNRTGQASGYGDSEERLFCRCNVNIGGTPCGLFRTIRLPKLVD